LIREIVDKVLSHLSEEKRYDICEFLKKQEIKEDDINEISGCLFVISKLYQDIPNLKLMFDENIKTVPRQFQVAYTREQIQNIQMIGISATEQIQNAALIEMCNSIKNEMINTENFLSTDGNFLSFSIIDNDTFSPKFRINVNCKVLSIKDLRKMKLDKINLSKNHQSLL